MGVRVGVGEGWFVGLDDGAGVGGTVGVGGKTFKAVP